MVGKKSNQIAGKRKCYFVIGDAWSGSVAFGVSSRVQINFHLIRRYVDMVNIIGGGCVELVSMWFATHVTRRLSQTM